MKENFYQNKQSENLKVVKMLTKKSNMLSLARLVFFIMMVVGLSIVYYERSIIYFSVSIVGIVAFIASVIWQNKTDWILQVKSSMDSLCLDYFKRQNHTWQELDNKGEKFKKQNSFLSSDLDIIGDNSLFQYLCLAKSNTGQKRLYDILNQQDKDISSITARQTAVSELANNQELHLKLASYINLFKADKSDLVLNDNNYLSKNETLVYWFLAYVYPISTILILAGAVLGYLSYGILAIVIVVNIILLLIRKKRNSEFVASVLDNHSNINIIIKVIEELEKNEYKSDLLVELKRVLVDDYQASKSLQKLVKFQERIQSQNNVLVYVIIDIFSMWDYKNVSEYDRWKKTWGSNAHKYLNIFYDVEVLLSLGVIEQTHSNTCLPSLIDTKQPKLSMTNAYHPLLNKETVIYNDFDSLNESIIITGSNMSGKTTFIRGVGTNLLLAYAGASVCASNFEVSYMKVLTSIRVEDDFNQGVSTFYAEIKRIKNMIEYSTNELPMITFIDEIFKGTNSEDRIYGATKAIEALSKPYSLNFITTHDAQLTKMTNVLNYHFAEYYENDEIKFDYKLKQGPCQTRNAKFLLKMAGIINE